MTTAVTRSSSADPAARRRWTALRRFVVERLREGFLIRAAFVLGIVIAIVCGSWMLALHWLAPGDAATTLLVAGVRWVSFVSGGIAAIALATDLGAQAGQAGFTALLQQRGFGPREVRRAQLYATARLIVGTLGVPVATLAMLGLALSPSLRILLGRLLLTLGLTGYVLTLSAVLALCARWSVAIDRHRSRWVLVAILLGPELAHHSGLAVPGIPSLFGELLAQVAALGVAV